MAVRPIIFSAPMVKALLAGTKTQTRRVLNAKPGMTTADCIVDRGMHPSGIGTIHELPVDKLAVRFAVGDVLYVREAYRTEARFDKTKANDLPDNALVSFEADYDYEPNDGCRGKLRPPLFHRRRNSRLTLEVTDVRVERLQDISEADAQAEGICRMDDGTWSWIEDTKVVGWHTPRGAFDALWTSINGPAAWAENPWIVALTFNVHRQNVDQYLAALASEARGVG